MTVASDNLATQVATTVSTMAAAKTKIVAQQATITGLQTQLANAPQDDSAQLTSLGSQLNTSTTALAAAIQAAS
jgi:hypothetical protein